MNRKYMLIKNNYDTYLLIGLFSIPIIQLFQFQFFAPFPEIGGDAVFKWEFAKYIYYGLPLDKFLPTEDVSHHIFRWVSWLQALPVIYVFGDNVDAYFLSTLIPSVIGGMVFAYLIYFYAGLIPFIIFLLFWNIDAQVFRGTFQLLPTGAGFLPLAILCFVIHANIQKKLYDHTTLIILSLLMFGLYGAKETNLFFAPGLFLFSVSRFGLPKSLIIPIIGFVLYTLETFFFLNLLGDKVHSFGRLLNLISGDHFQGQSAIEITYLDAGIISRWIFVPDSQKVINILSLLSIFYFAHHWRKNRLVNNEKNEYLKFLCLMLVSFIFMTSFFFISIDPLRLGQPLLPRFLGIFSPLALSFLLILPHWQRVTVKKQALLLFMPILVFCYFLNNDRPNSRVENIHVWKEHYTRLARNLPETICVTEQTSKKWIEEQLWYYPNSERNTNFPIVDLSERYYENGLIIKGKLAECDPHEYIVW